MTLPLRRVLLALACSALCAGLLAACGGGDGDAKPDDAAATTLLARSFGPTGPPIDNGRMSLNFQLDPEGLLAAGGPIKLVLSGPFAAPAKGELPRFDVTFAATLAGERFPGGVTSTGTKAFVRLDDDPYAIDGATVGELRDGLGALSSGNQPGLRSIGIDPLRWTSEPKVAGKERVAGVETTRVRAKIDVAKLLADLDGFLTRAGGAAAPGTANLLSPKLRAQIAGAVTSATADIWVGTSDRILRRAAVLIDFAFEKGKSPVLGLNGGKIDLRLRIDKPNTTTVKVRAPEHAPALSTLTGGGIDGFFAGLSLGLDRSKGGIVGGLFLGCITSALGKTADLVRCISELPSQAGS